MMGTYSFTPVPIVFLYFCIKYGKPLFPLSRRRHHLDFTCNDLFLYVPIDINDIHIVCFKNT